MTEPLVRVQDLEKYYFERDTLVDRLLLNEPQSVKAVDGVSFEIERGETLGLVGESGCGKSTTGETLLRLREATGGSVVVDGQAVFELDGDELVSFRENAQIVFQDPFSSLDPRMTAGDIVREPLDVHGVGTRAERRERSRDLLERVGLSADQAERYPHEFSGGQRQRIGIARALALEPEFIVLDEPVSALDVSVQAQVLNLLADLQEEFGLTYLFIAHDLSVVRHICDRVAVMYLGNVVEVGPVDRIFEAPRHPYTKALLESVPRATADEYGRDVDPLSGDVPSPRDPPSGCRFHTRCPALVPAEDWPGTQDAFRAGFTFRNRLEEGEVDVAAIRARLDAEDETTDDDAVVAEVIEQSLPGEPSRLPAEAETLVRETAAALVAGDPERALAGLRETFRTPCERSEPAAVALDDGRTVACHRVTPNER